MAKIVALDIGGKRTGIAETDPLQIIAEPKETIANEELLVYLKKLFSREKYEAIVIGNPLGLDGKDSDNSERVRNTIQKLKAEFSMPVISIDERFTSKLAKDALLQSGLGKFKRRDKAEVDKVSAAIILQSYLQRM